MAYCVMYGIRSYHALWQGIAYIMDWRKTAVHKEDASHCAGFRDHREYMERYVAGLNLVSADTAAREFSSTCARFGVRPYCCARHIIQSFSRSENAGAETVHSLGCELASRLFPYSEAVVATHVNTDNLHSHIIANTVSFVGGDTRSLSKEAKRRHPNLQWYTREMRYVRDVSSAVTGEHGVRMRMEDDSIWSRGFFMDYTPEEIDERIRLALRKAGSVRNASVLPGDMNASIDGDDDLGAVLAGGEAGVMLCDDWEVDEIAECWNMYDELAIAEDIRQWAQQRPVSCTDTLDGRITPFEAQILYWMKTLRADAVNITLDRPKRYELQSVTTSFSYLRRNRIRTEEDVRARISALSERIDRLADEMESCERVLARSPHAFDMQEKFVSAMSERKDLLVDRKKLYKARDAAQRALQYEGLLEERECRERSGMRSAHSWDR